MRRLSARRKHWLIFRQRNEQRRLRCRRSSAYRQGRVAQAKATFRNERTKLPGVLFDTTRYPGHAAFIPPAHFSLEENYEDTLKFIMDFQQYFFEKRRHLCNDGNRRPVYADFPSIESIEAGAGLVLAAEVHRYAQAIGKRPLVYDNLWRENVRQFFVQAGLFKLLNIDPKDVTTRPSEDQVRMTLQFTSGRTAEGKDALRLVRRLQDLSGRNVGPGPTVYTAVAEALANVGHAYPQWFRRWPYRSSRRWWASGFWRPSNKTVGIQLYDQGAGIPATLPKQTYWPKLLKLLDSEGTPAGLIAAALTYGRTSTGQPGRGKGLSEMADWVERTGTGYLRILSGGGQIVYRPGGAIEQKNLSVPFCGTLVEWEVTVDD